MNAALLSFKQAIPLAQVTRRTPKPLEANDTPLTSIAATPGAVQVPDVCDHHRVSALFLTRHDSIEIPRNTGPLSEAAWAL